MSIFSLPHQMLNPVLWTPEEKLHPEAKEYFMQLLEKIYPLAKVDALVMIGSSVGHQYSPTSDIDINMQAVKGESYDAWHKVFKNFASLHNYYPGTQHPINFFFQEYAGNGDWSNSLGAYDIFQNTWLKRPIPFNKIGDPATKYEREIAYGHMLLEMIASEVAAIRRSVAAGTQLETDRRLKELSRIFHKVDENRKLSYRYHTGTPALHENNILYKMIEDSEYAELFHELVEKYNGEVF